MCAGRPIREARFGEELRRERKSLSQELAGLLPDGIGDTEEAVAPAGAVERSRMSIFTRGPVINAISHAAAISWQRFFSTMF
jgi:hypothetical protein